MMRYSAWEEVCEQKTYNRLRSKLHETGKPVRWLKKFRIRPDKPGYCKAYFDHNLTTAGDKVRYVGDERNGGRWVDVRWDYLGCYFLLCFGQALPDVRRALSLRATPVRRAFTDQSPFEKRVLMCEKSKRAVKTVFFITKRQTGKGLEQICKEGNLIVQSKGDVAKRFAAPLICRNMWRQGLLIR